MNREDYLNQWHKWHDQYTLFGYRHFRKFIKQGISEIDVDNIDYFNYKFEIQKSFNVKRLELIYRDFYTTIGIKHGNRIGRALDKTLKAYSSALFNEEFQKFIIDWIRSNIFNRITSVNNNMIKQISKYIEFALGENYSLEEMQRYLRTQINDPRFTRIIATRIARTETTAAANLGAFQSANQAGVVLEKFWISAQDKRTRDGNPEDWNHLRMNGKKVGKDEAFEMRSNKGIINLMQYPGDPKGSAGNVINCRCTVAFRGKRDANGNLIFL
jgi:hypothetical protein